MQERELTYGELNISLSDIYGQMGYGDAEPDGAVVREVEDMLLRIRKILRPRFCFFIAKAALDTDNNILEAVGTKLDIGRIITRQLRGSSAYVFFVATGGMEFERFQHRLKDEEDMVRVYIADAVGSVIAEKTADRMEEVLRQYLRPSGWHHTNRFSPGYCGWHVSEQQRLFRLFPVQEPCGVRLTESSLMVPIKSVSGVIGIGEKVRKLEYTCGLCDYKDCYKRRRPKH